MNTMHNKQKRGVETLLKVLNVLGILVTFAFLLWAWKQGLFISEDRFLTFMAQFGILAPVVFYIVQIIQTVIPIIPGAITIPLGIVMFGNFWGFIHNLIPIFIGSILNFYLARRYGRTLVQVLVGDKNYEKATKWLSEQKLFKRIIVLGLTLPFMPADLICYVAGLSSIKFKKYLRILIVGKPISIALYAYGTLFLIESMVNIF